MNIKDVIVKSTNAIRTTQTSDDGTTSRIGLCSLGRDAYARLYVLKELYHLLADHILHLRTYRVDLVYRLPYLVHQGIRMARSGLLCLHNLFQACRIDYHVLHV